MYNRYICECCGAHLDPGEPCNDCQRARNMRKRKLNSHEIIEKLEDLEWNQEELEICC